MKENDFTERLKNVNQLTVAQQLLLRNDILKFEARLIRPWWFDSKCEVNVLVVTDGALNFGIGGFGLSNFLTIFKKMEAESNINIKYNVTLGHRDTPGNLAMQASNPDFVSTITDFKFDNTNHFTKHKYDQVWLFGYNASPISDDEVEVIDKYMNHGGGVFATGDHGSIGTGLCGKITRVKEMRYWKDFGNGEVSMSQSRRNDTNTPHSGNVSSFNVGDQSDEYPQNIHAKMYGAAPNVLPHYLLSIKKSIKSSGIIDIMPDHPHEGECQPEQNFVVKNPETRNNQSIRTQNIAISFVNAGNTSGGKTPTQAHCFASIGVFDGRPANVGRIVVDATWHHFVNMNLQGFTQATLDVIFEYYKNIAKWMTRKKRTFCPYRRYLVHAMLTERIMEANTLDINIKSADIPDDELFTIGKHAINIVESELTPADALEFKIAMLETVVPTLAKKINIWDLERKPEADFIHNQFINYEPLVAVAIGLGIARVKDAIGVPSEPITQHTEMIIQNTFDEGAAEG
ncbi:MAG: hypothetical protein AAF617_10580, partial [Bacteroidota bacterium]